jgi:argininosuccinate synthase
VRCIELTVKALAPQKKIIAPGGVEQQKLEEEIDYAEAHHGPENKPRDELFQGQNSGT